MILSDEQTTQMWRYILACMTQAKDLTEKAAQAADQIKESERLKHKPKLELVKDDE